MNEHRQKIAIVCSGGGMKCSYSSGALVALARDFNFRNPDIVIASSGSGGGVCYYLADQIDSIPKIWEELLPSSKLISYLRLNKVLDVDYLVDEVFKKQEPLDVKKLKDTKTEVFFTATEASTGLGIYLTKEDGDVFELIRATVAMPFIYRKKVKVNNNFYIDGTIALSFQDQINKAIDMGATHVIAIDNSTLPFIFLREFLTKVYRLFLYGKFSSIDSTKINYTNAKIIFIKDNKSEAKLLTKDKKVIEKAFDQGYRDILENEEIRKLFFVS